MRRRTTPSRPLVLLGAVALLSLVVGAVPWASAETSGQEAPEDQPSELVCDHAAEPLPGGDCEIAPAPEPPAEPDPAPAPDPPPEAQPDPVPEPEPVSEPVPAPPPDPGPSPTPGPLDGPGSGPGKPPGASEAPEGSAGRERSPVPSAPQGAELEPGGAEPGAVPFSYLRGQGSTERLIEILGPLEDHGVSLEEALLRVAGPFPMAGLSWWTNDWHAYRCCPEPHLHRGLDMFAEEGTPLVAIADGRVTGRSLGQVSGLAVEITDRAGVEYYYAHLSAFAQDLRLGQEVSRGDVIGFVGDTGNARGTMPHLHLEVQPGGVSVPPLPYVEGWLLEAERTAARWVERVTGAAPELAPRTAAAAPTRRLLEHPGVSGAGATPVSVEGLDRRVADARVLTAAEPAASLALTGASIPSSPVRSRVALVLLAALALLLAAAVSVGREPARRRRPEEPPPPIEPVVEVAAEPMPIRDQEERAGRRSELVATGLMLLWIVGAVLQLSERRSWRSR